MPKQRDGFENEVAKAIGAAIRKRRENLNIPREKVADLLGCTVRSIKAYEEGARRFSLADAFSVANLLHARIDDLLYEAPKPPDPHDSTTKVQSITDLRRRRGGLGRHR